MFTISEGAVPLTDRRALAGVRAVDFTDMFIGPMVALSLADLGADSIKVEILNRAGIRLLDGSGASCFPTYDGSRRCLCIDLGAGTEHHSGNGPLWRGMPLERTRPDALAFAEMTRSRRSRLATERSARWI
jgi:hypothetical protein